MNDQQQHEQTFTDSDGNIFRGAEAIAAAAAHFGAEQTRHEKLAREHPKEWARYAKAIEDRGRRFERDPRRKQKSPSFRRRAAAARPPHSI